MKTDLPIKGLVERLRDNKKLETAVYAILAIAAAVIFFAWGGISCDKGKGAAPEAEKPEENAALSERALEERLEAILSRIDGAGKVSVMITYDSGSTLVTAEESTRTTGGNGSSESVKPSTVSGGGSQSPIVLTEIMPKIRGVIVVAEGADNIRVRVELQNAVMTVLAAEPSAISVFPMDHH